MRRHATAFSALCVLLATVAPGSAGDDVFVLRPAVDPLSVSNYPVAESLLLRGAYLPAISEAINLRSTTSAVAELAPAGGPELLNLRDTVAATESHHLGLRAAIADAESVRGRVWRSMAAFVPTISGSLDQRRERTLDTIAARKDSQNSTVPGLTVSFPLYTGGQLTNGLHRARSEAYAAYADANAKRDEVSLQAVEAMMRFHQANRFTSILNQNVRGLERLIAAVHARQSGGLASAADTADVKAELSANKIELARNSEQLMQTRIELEKLTGRSVGALPRLESLDRQLEAGRDVVLAAARGGSPRAIAARHRADAARYQVAETRGKYLPRVDVYGKYERYVSETRRPEIWSAGVRLVVPFFDASLAGDVIESRERANAMRYRSIDTDREISAQIQTDWTTWAGASQRMRLARDRVEALRRVVASREARYSAGMGSIDDVLNERRRLATAEIAMVQTETERAQSAARVLATAGILGRSLQSSAPPVRRAPHG